MSTTFFYKKLAQQNFYLFCRIIGLQKINVVVRKHNFDRSKSLKAFLNGYHPLTVTSSQIKCRLHRSNRSHRHSQTVLCDPSSAILMSSGNEYLSPARIRPGMSVFEDHKGPTGWTLSPGIDSLLDVVRKKLQAQPISSIILCNARFI